MPKVIIQIEFEATTDGLDKAVSLIKYADTLNAPVTVPVTGNGKAAPKTAQAAKPATSAAKPATPAKKAAAPAAAPKAAAKPAPDPLADVLGGDDDEDEKEPGGLGLGDGFDDAQQDFKGTPEEAKEEALGMLRVMLANGHKDSVKRVQQVMKVAKFHDVPPEQGYEFLKKVKDVQAKL